MKSLETTWNQLKLAESTQKLPAIFCYLLVKINYSQVAFVLIFHPKTFLGKFGPKNLSSRNWLKFGKGVHCYMLVTVLMFIFFKFFSFIFLGNFGPKIWSSSNWQKFPTGVHCYVVIIFWGNLVPKSEVLQINWNLVQVYIAIYLLHFKC